MELTETADCRSSDYTTAAQRPKLDIKWRQTTTPIVRSYYGLTGQTIAVRVSNDPLSTNNGLWQLHGDHLGSSRLMSDASGAVVTNSTTRFLPYGGYRTTPTNSRTDRGFTGHQMQDELGLVYMRARWFVPGVGRFASADTIVPDPMNPQSYNRFSYVLNNPLRFIDPTGHRECEGAGANCSNEALPLPRNPWILTNDMVDLNGDNVLTDTEEILGTLFYQAQAEQAFLQEMADPADGLGRFGGPNTLRPSAGDYHPAVDGGGNRGDRVNAVAYGRVVATGNVGGAGPNFGNYVVVEHDVYGTLLYSTYAHLENQSVSVGEFVDAGTEIGTMGDSNGQSSVHLHFEVRKATNVNLSEAASDPFKSNFWADSDSELHSNWVDLGPVYGYHSQYPGSWTRNDPIQR